MTGQHIGINWKHFKYYLFSFVNEKPFSGEAVFECDVEKDNMPILDTGFDSEKCLCCSIENGHTLVHTPGGRGYGLGTTPIYSGQSILKLKHQGTPLYASHVNPASAGGYLQLFMGRIHSVNT